MSATTRDLDRIAVEGYIYLYPMVLMDVTRRVATGPAAGAREGVGPAGAFQHHRAFPPGDFTEVVRPNFDTLYSTAWVDLSHGPQVVSLARPVDRYFMLPILDMWTDVFAVIGTRTTGGGAAEYVLVPPGWGGEVPSSMVRIDAPTACVWIIGRTVAAGVADYPAVHAIQDAFGMRALEGEPAPAPVGDVDLVTPPMDQVASMTGEEFFRLAAGLLADNPPHLTDQPILARLAALGVVPGEPFEPAHATAAARAAIAAAPPEALGSIRAAIVGLSQMVDGWSTRRAGIGVYGTDYLFRAVIAMVGLGANLPEDAIYPMLLQDEDGAAPVGENDYVLRFEADRLPPVDEFWSVTIYDGAGFTVPNPLDRYALGDRDALEYGPDGSLEILVGRSSPGPGREGNWLPAPAGPLSLTMRLYGPRPEALDGRWSPPPLRRRR